MTGTDESDPELAALRARRIQELIAARSAPPPTAVPTLPSTTPLDLSASSFGAFLAEHPRVVIDVWAPWCGPCRTMAPILDGLAKELAADVRFGKVNADNEPMLAAQYRVEGIPTLLLFDHGRLVDKVVGAVPGHMLRSRIRSVFRIGS